MIVWCQKCETNTIPYCKFSLPLCGLCSYPDGYYVYPPTRPPRDVDSLFRLYTTISKMVDSMWCHSPREWTFVVGGSEDHIIRSEN